MINDRLLLLLIALIPFGQIFRIPISTFGFRLVIQPIDVVVGLILISVLFDKVKRTRFIKTYGSLIYFLVFSWILGSLTFSIFSLQSIFYLFRLVAYISLVIFVGFIDIDSTKLIKSLGVVTLISLIFGWVQYFYSPDLRGISIYGWDEHLYRLVGSHIDPGFTGIMMVLGLITFLSGVFSGLLTYTLSSLTVLTILFTYSRASYLAMFASLFLSLIYTKFKKLILVLIVSSFIIILILPRPFGEGVRLERTSTAVFRINNYIDTINIWKESPVFGVGYNNICEFKENKMDNSCSGSDSSILLILATTGVAGLILFIKFLEFPKYLKLLRDPIAIHSRVIVISAIVVLIHSSFNNTLFYPWVMAWMALLIGSIKHKPRHPEFSSGSI